MGKKDKARRHQTQKQRKALKKTRRAILLKKLKPTRSSSHITEQVFPNKSMAFWAAHGINCILSDYETGTWTPLFEGIYGETPITLTPTEVSTNLLQKFGSEGVDWPLDAKSAFAWMTQKREVMYAYYQTALRRAKENYPDADAENLITQPHNSITWGLFSELKQQLKEPQPEKNIETSPQVGTP